MAKKLRTAKSSGKEVKRLFDRSFDLARLNLAKRSARTKPKAMLFGFATAGIIYIVAYSLGYYGFSQNIMPIGAFAKLTWILMIPATVVGMFVWIIVKNRLEYPVRADIRDYITELEAGKGLIWRFLPLWEQFDGTTGATKKAMSWSAEKKIDKLDVDDYVDAVFHLYRILQENEAKQISDTTAEGVIRNFDEEPA